MYIYLDWMVFISHFVHVFILEITLGESGVQPKVIHFRTLAHKEEKAKKFFWKGQNIAYYTKAMEALLKGKAHYNWPLCTNQFTSAPCYIKNFIYTFYKTS